MRGLYRFARGLLALLGLLFLLVTFTPIDFWWVHLLDEPWNDPHGDIMIVPGAEMQTDGTIGLGTYWRTVYAARFWREGGWKQIVVSGAGVGFGMRDFLVASGVPASAILVESGSHSTRENALYTARLLHGVQGRKVLVTSDYHLYRAGRAFRAAGLDVQPRPVPDLLKAIQSRWNRWSEFLNLCGETAKIAYYTARGWI